MSKIQTIAAPEQFLMQVNGDYNVPFDEVEMTAAVVSGQVIEISTGVYGIAAQAGAIGDVVRVMTRGNPSTVNAKALVDYVAATHRAALAEVGIVVVNA